MIDQILRFIEEHKVLLMMWVTVNLSITMMLMRVAKIDTHFKKWLKRAEAKISSDPEEFDLAFKKWGYDILHLIVWLCIGGGFFVAASLAQHIATYAGDYVGLTFGCTLVVAAFFHLFCYSCFERKYDKLPFTQNF